MPRVSVIIPTYNNPAMLVQAVESVLGQTYRDYELVVVDDGSGPETRAALGPYTGRIRYLRQENAGPSAARNRGIRESSGELVAFLDHDDLWLREKLSAQVAFMDAHGEFPLTYHAVDYLRDEEVLSLPRREGPSGDVFARLFKRIFLITLAVMCRRDCFDAAGLFSETLRYAQDYDMWLRMALRYRFGYLDRVLGRYRFHRRNLSWENEMRPLEEKLLCRERLGRHPAAAGRLPRRLYHREVASATFKLAKLHLAAGDASGARGLVLRSIRHRPVEFRRWLFYLRANLA